MLEWRINQGGATALAVLAVSLVSVSVAVAQQPSTAQVDAIRKDCRADFITYCPGVQPGGQDAVRCLLQNTAKLSPPCNGALGAVVPSSSQPAGAMSEPAQAPTADQDRLKAVREACTLADFASHCSWIEPTNPELLLCLHANAAPLSPNCRGCRSKFDRVA